MLRIICNSILIVICMLFFENAYGEILGGTPSLDGKDWNVDIRSGLETSTFTAGNSASNSKLFSNQNLFIDISINTFPFSSAKWIEIVPEFRFGKENVAGEEVSNPGITKFFKDAEVIEGGASIIFHRDVYKIQDVEKAVADEDKTKSIWYFKITPSFIYTTEDRLTKDFRSEFFGGIGYINIDNKSPLYGSSIEAGSGYSEKYESKFRLIKTKIELTNLNYKVQPFLTIRVDNGKGPDDLKVFYGVRLPIDTIFSAITATK